MDCQHLWSRAEKAAAFVWAEVLGNYLDGAIIHVCNACGALRVARAGSVSVVRPSATDRHEFRAAAGSFKDAFEVLAAH